MGVQCSAGAIIALLALTSPNLLHYFVSDDVPRVKMTKHWLLGLLAVPAVGQKVISLGPSVTLSYSITGDQASVSVVYEGTAWLGFGVTSLKMPGSKICIGSSAGGALTAQQYVNGPYSAPTPEGDDLSAVSFSQSGGQTILAYTAPLAFFEQFTTPGGPVKLIWAHGGSSSAIAYHSGNKAVVPLQTFRIPDSPPPPLPPSPAGPPAMPPLARTAAAEDYEVRRQR